MSEKTGIEMLEEILQRLNIIDQQLKVMDQNIKTIANSAKLSELVNKAAGAGLNNWSKAAGVPGLTKPAFGTAGMGFVEPSGLNPMELSEKPGIPDDVKKQLEEIKAKTKSGFKNFSFMPSDSVRPDSLVSKDIQAIIPKVHHVLVTGKLKIEKDGFTVPLSGASVKIFDISDKLVKNTKTNRAGQWMSHLAPGKYVALFEGEINGQKLLPQNKNFEVPESLPDGQVEFEVI